MQKINKLSASFLILLITNSCALKPKVTNDQAYYEIKKYKNQSQKNELNRIVSEKPIRNKKEFLVKLYNKKVHSWINYFSKRDKERFERYLKNGYQYKELIEKIFSSYDLPKDLFYVGLIESGYYLKARSRANAVGPWQFIRATGKRYNLSINSKVDERRSIIKSTHAAAKYFQDLYNIFGSWELALSAYNAGEYGIIRRIRGANTRDFYKLAKMKKLPKETRNYVPKVLAAMEVAKNPMKYSLNMPNIEFNRFQNLKAVNIKGSYSLHSLSKAYKVSEYTIKLINNDLKRNITPYYPRDGYTLYLPQNSKISSLRGIKQIRKRSIAKRAKIRRSRTIAGKVYKVRRGDNLYSIARKYHVRFRRLKQLNKLKSSKIYVGQKIKIPSSRAKVHTVKKGDYLIKIAKTYGTTPSNLRKINKKSFRKIMPGQKIIISYN